MSQHRHRSRSRSYSRSRSRSPGHRHRRHHSRSRSRSRDRGDRDRGGDRHRSDRHYSGSGRDSSYRRKEITAPPLHGRGKFGAPRGDWEKSVGGPMNAPAEEAEAHAKVSKRENRIYVGNLAYDVNYKDLAKFMSGAGGNVIFSEVLTTPAGQSKGCGIVEFATQEEAQRAKQELSDKAFMGRACFIREDREETARFGAPSIPGKIGMAMGEARTFLGNQAPVIPNKNIFVGNLPLQASWQDLKDLMRQAGEVIRADVGMTMDGQPKGNGTVVFVNPDDARAAIEMFNGFDWFGNILEVREDRFANGPFRGRGGFRGGFAPRGGFGFRGGFGGGFRGGFMGPGMGFRGGFGGGMGRGGMGFNQYGGGHQAAAAAGGRSFNDNIYADYNGPDGSSDAMAVDGSSAAGSGLKPQPAEPNQQILVRNLPWSTANEDLVELFETIGNVVLAEVLFEAGRSKGEGIVQFTETAEAQLASEKFTGYMYGGRPLDVQFNPRWHEFSSAAVKGGQVPPAANAVRHLSASTSAPTSAVSSHGSSPSSSRPLKVAIIGSGPSGFYTASRILSSLPIDSPSGAVGNVEVHMYERLPTPYGLVRYGVAPDHPEVKNCQHKFDELCSDPRFKFFGNVLLSSQPSSSPTIPTPSTSLSPYTYPHALRISFDDILPFYNSLVLTYGASSSNPLSSVSGSSSSEHPLGGVIPALALVSWYNSHPAFTSLPISLKGIEEVSVIGQGNVALDVARILLKPVSQLEHTDLSEDVLHVLSQSDVKRVRVVGRRGPGQVAFTTKEFREMLSLPGVGYSGVDQKLMDHAKSLVGNERMRKRLLGLMEKPVTSTSDDGNTKEFKLDFLKSPSSFIPDTSNQNQVKEVEWSVNELLSTTPAPAPTPPSAALVARPTGEKVRIKADMVVESVGYRSEPLTGDNNGRGSGGWLLPFDRSRGRVSNVNGRVVDSEGVVVPGVYTAGWAARGPVGVIASTMHDAYSIADTLLSDHFDNPSSSPASASSTMGGPLHAHPEEGVPPVLSGSEGRLRVVSIDNWKKIDQAERDRAKVGGKGKEREKFRTVEEMLAVLR
ncbi:RNP domain-containing protein [Kwoniella heveanensis CBS 569]|nr:RNP domain-containing protein [Kwoniella heveanensis CBS 569]